MNILDTTYLDLVLLHWPYNNIKECYKALEDLYNAGTVKAIGVSNFDEILLEDLYNNSRFKPMLNQVETHIYFQEKKMNKYLQEKEIAHESWAPFAEGYLNMLEDENLKIIAKKYNKSVAQIILRFLIQKNIIVIPKSTNKNHIKENINIFDFELDEKDIKTIELLDKKTQYSNWPQNMKIETEY
jgi:diketogulonate reductase-like aldo/keto reductase